VQFLFCVITNWRVFYIHMFLVNPWDLLTNSYSIFLLSSLKLAAELSPFLLHPSGILFFVSFVLPALSPLSDLNSKLFFFSLTTFFIFWTVFTGKVHGLFDPYLSFMSLDLGENCLIWSLDWATLKPSLEGKPAQSVINWF